MARITLTFMQRFMSELDTAIKTYVSSITGSLNGLHTTDKTSLVDAINEITDKSGATELNGLSDVDISSPTNGQVLSFNSTTNKWENKAGGGSSATFLSQTLTTGSTSVTFTGIPTTGNNVVDIYTSKKGLDYTSINDSTAGTLVVNYEAQSNDVTVYLRIEEVVE